MFARFFEILAFISVTYVWDNSADYQLNILSYIFFLFFPENSMWYFMQIVSSDNLHEMSNLFFFSGKNKKNISICRVLKNFTQTIKR